MTGTEYDIFRAAHCRTDVPDCNCKGSAGRARSPLGTVLMPQRRGIHRNVWQAFKILALASSVFAPAAKVDSHYPSHICHYRPAKPCKRSTSASRRRTGTSASELLMPGLSMTPAEGYIETLPRGSNRTSTSVSTCTEWPR